MLNSDIPVVLTGMNKRGRKKQRKDDEQCLVCGGRSAGINFGVYTCSPCKAFFRRNAVKLGIYEFVCSRDGDCPVTNNTRRQCNCCRLAKCFRVGMNRNFIRTEDERLERNRLIEYNRQKRAETNLTIQPVNLSRSFYLSSNDQTLLTNIFNAYEKTCISFRYDKYQNMPYDHTLSLEKFVNSFSSMYMSFIEFFKFIPEFTDLSLDTKILLLKNNFNQIFRLNSAFIVHATGSVEDIDSIAFKHVFPNDLYSQLCSCALNLLPFVYDPIFLKLLFIILMFSTSLSTRYDIDQIFFNTDKLFSIQNFYIELLWRYLLNRSSTYRDSVRILSSFVTRLLHSQTVNENLTEYISKKMSNQTNQLEPIMQAMWISEKNQ